MLSRLPIYSGRVLIDPDTHALTIVLVVVGIVIVRDRAIAILPTLFALRGGAHY